ncbi:MAG: hypothetical protein KDC72_00365, partial [Bacteroidetes bacterium]|nr:hypothetical protein [Bacteroidota bacterium]
QFSKKMLFANDKIHQLLNWHTSSAILHPYGGKKGQNRKHIGNIPQVRICLVPFPLCKVQRIHSLKSSKCSRFLILFKCINYSNSPRSFLFGPPHLYRAEVGDMGGGDLHAGLLYK